MGSPKPIGTQMITLCATDARGGVGGFGAFPARFWGVFVVVVVVVVHLFFRVVVFCFEV